MEMNAIQKVPIKCQPCCKCQKHQKRQPFISKTPRQHFPLSDFRKPFSRFKTLKILLLFSPSNINHYHVKIYKRILQTSFLFIDALKTKILRLWSLWRWQTLSGPSNSTLLLFAEPTPKRPLPQGLYYFS